MSEYIDAFRSKVNEQKAREAFPEITATENLVWIGSPHVLSMLSHYVLALLIILLHLLFYWATEGSPIVGESRLSHLFSKTKYILDFLVPCGDVACCTIAWIRLLFTSLN